MARFVVHVDLFGGLSLDEWLGEDEKNQMTKKGKICHMKSAINWNCPGMNRLRPNQHL